MKNENVSKRRPSSVKANGLKSAFVLENGDVLMTSFGNGNKAVLEKQFDKTNEVKKEFSNEPSVQIKPSKDNFGYTVKSRRYDVQDDTEKKTIRDDPRAYSKNNSSKKPGDDLIHCRRNIELQFFGKTFEDNIHIQIAYKIYDINKILSVHVNNIAYALNNIIGISEHEDLLTGLKLDSQPYEKFIIDENKDDSQKEKIALFKRLLMSSRRNYFGDILNCDKEKDKKEKDKGFEGIIDAGKAEFLYTLLCLLAEVRHSTAHATDVIYALEKNDRTLTQTALLNVKCLYKDKIQRLNRKFLENSQKDINILFKVYNASTEVNQQNLINEYYDFVVRKTQKNIGFSIKTLREILIDTKCHRLKGVHYDSVRARLYRLLDFVIYESYLNHEKTLNDFVNGLRAKSTSEEGKMNLYVEEASKTWKEIEPKVSVITSNLENIMSNHFDVNESIEKYSLENRVDHPKYAFSNIVFLLTQFVDAKEINDLLTTLINNFDNIASFIAVLKESGLSCEFVDKYQMFIHSDEIVEDLRTINSIARMPSKAEPNAKLPMYYDALKILGSEKDDDELNDFLKKQLGVENKDHNFRNFIANNVINSSRFIYLVRYANPQKIRRIAGNRKVIEFVLNGIPDEQILRYYNSCNQCDESECKAEFRSNLADIITKMSEDGFHDVKQNKKGAKPEEIADNFKKQASIRLYLTVLYLLVKNLVYINSRYFMAFMILERDARITYSFDESGKKISNKNLDKLGLKKFTDSNTIKNDYSGFAKKYIDEHPYKNRVDEYIRKNISNSDPQILREYRNCVDHLSALRKADEYIEDLKEVTSYYQIYHYIVQRYLKDQYEFKTTPEYKEKNPDVVFENKKTLEYFEKIMKFGTYSKDFVKALNVPFAYNLPRYKNLSIADLFDRNCGIKTKENTANDKIDALDE